MRRNPVIHLLRRSLILLLILVVADRLIGAALEKMFYRQKHGDDAVTLYTLASAHEDLLVFGSSRASHHYNTRMMDSLLGVSVYNCGRDEMGLSYSTAVLPAVYKRYSPKVIILEVLPTELGSASRLAEYQHISSRLIPYANRYPELWPAVAFAGKAEVYKAAICKTYAYNSLLLSIIQNTYTNLGHTTDLGYEPLAGQIDSASYKPTTWLNIQHDTGVSSLLAARFCNMLDEAAARGTQVCVVISPFYYNIDLHDIGSYRALPALSALHGAHFMDWSHDARFLMHPEFFKDDVHLNDRGARLYTGIIADTLKKLRGLSMPLNNRMLIFEE